MNILADFHCGDRIVFIKENSYRNLKYGSRGTYIKKGAFGRDVSYIILDEPVNGRRQYVVCTTDLAFEFDYDREDRLTHFEIDIDSFLKGDIV